MKDTSANLLKTEAFIYVLKGFKVWLKTLGYAPSTVYRLPLLVKEYFLYLETQSKTELEAITQQSIEDYYQNHLQKRQNKRRSYTQLSNAHLNKHQQGLNLLCSYLRKNGRAMILAPHINYEVIDLKAIEVLSREDIKHLFELTRQHEDNSYQRTLALRDRAMLSLFYACGLRRTEAYKLDLYDINLDKHYLHIRFAKGNKERFVPFTKETKSHFQHYIYDSRPRLLKGKQDAFLISERGNRLYHLSMSKRLKSIAKRSHKQEFTDKSIHLHLLRHSIATHLLEQGMPLEDIAQFLGHSSLESTQRYTHIDSSKPRTNQKSRTSQNPRTKTTPKPTRQ